MNLSKLSNQDKLDLCRKYYYGGFALLPFLWLVNGLWFFKYAICSPPFDEQAQLRKYVIRSLVGCLLWTIAFIAWIVVFQTNRVSWGEAGDSLSFTFPRGDP